MSRLQKYNSQKKKKLILFSKIVVVLYLLIFSFSYLTGGTIAYFSNANTATLNFAAGKWFDGSKLQFVGNNGTDVDQSCPTVEISADFKNVGHKMQGPAKYEVYYTEQGSNGGGAPENHGSPIFEGQIQALDKEEVITLSFVTENEGFYAFKVYQREGFEGKDKDKEIWSNKFKVQCKEIKEDTKNETEEVEQEEVISEGEVNETPQTEEQNKSEDEAEKENQENEPSDSDTSQEESTENNPSNEQKNDSAVDVPEDQGNTSGEAPKGETNNSNKQPAGEGETNEETD